MALANPGRVAAAQALLEVEAGAHVEDSLGRLAPQASQDRSLAWFLALGVLRRRARVDAALRPFLSRPLDALDPELRAALRIGSFERQFARTPPHAVVDQAVEVACAIGGGRGKGLVNAVMRKVGAPRDLSPAEAADHPDWLYERWVERFGEAATNAWCERNNQDPALVLVARDDAAVLSAKFRDSGLAVTPVERGGTPVPGLLRLDDYHGPVTALPGFAEGEFWVQDAASVAAADLVGAPPGTQVLDACAAPGGKSFRLASQGARVVALDRDTARLGLLRDSATRLGFTIETHRHDWAKPWIEHTFSHVLLDAPCTGLGTVRRHPEIKWRRIPDDMTSAAKIQAVILDRVAAHVAPGGVLVYAVCSSEPEEGTQQIRAFLHRDPSFRLDREFCSAPPADDEDAFYGARLVRA